MRSMPFVAATLTLSCAATGQRILHSHVLPPFHEVDNVIRPAGDTNGDGKKDFVVAVRNNSTPNTTYEVIIASGANGTPLRTLPQLQQPIDAVGLGDVNLDGRSDVAVATNTALIVYSGATGSQLYSVPPPAPGGSYVAVCDVGDWNSDGRADIGVVTYVNGQSVVRLLRGENGQQLIASQPYPNNNAEATLRSIGDINQDGRADVVFATKNQAAYVVQTTSPMTTPVTLPSANADRTVRAADLDGDNVSEVLSYVAGSSGPYPLYGRFEVIDARTGSTRITLLPIPGSFEILDREAAVAGDLNGDGTADLVVFGSWQTSAGGLRAVSGSTGTELWAFDNNGAMTAIPPFCTIDDVDGDGLPDLAVNGRVQQANRGWLILAGRTLADVRIQTGACGGGPFLPRLGLTRPVLGQQVTAVGTDGPPATNGLLLFSTRPPFPTYLGASTCTAWFEYGNASVLQVLTSPTWTFGAPIPNVPQLAGFEFALQSYYAPTGGPLGYDLGNGLWARVGYQ